MLPIVNLRLPHNWRTASQWPPLPSPWSRVLSLTSSPSRFATVKHNWRSYIEHQIQTLSERDHHPVLHQRGELGLLAVQEVANECLLKEVHKVDRPEPTTQLLCGMEGPFSFNETLFRLSDSVKPFFHFSNFLPQTNTYKSNLVDLAPCARLFPQTNVDSCTMVHLWPKVRD